jgi:two-component system, cell cycle sensor histidine kinase and response regulator CckA
VGATICASSARLFAEARFATAVILVSGEVVDANQSTADLFGETAPSALWNRNLNEWITSASELKQICASTQAIIRLECRLHRSDGEDRVVLVSAWMLSPNQSLDPAKEIVLEDISERRQLELQLRQAQKMEALGRLAGGVAHDFNNLLMAIQGTCELILLRHDPDEALAHRVQVIARATDQGAQLTRQLLAFSRRQILQPTEVQVNDCLRELQKLLVHFLGEDIIIALELSADPLATVIDGGQLQQVLLNVAVNARDAMPTGGTLTLRSSRCRVSESNLADLPELVPGEYVAISVADSGCGIDQQTLQHIFEPFYTTKPQGTGLGLSTAYGIVKQSHGGISAESQPGRGTTFHIYLPSMQGNSEASSASPEVVRSAKSATVLIVEDEEMVRRSTAEFLELIGHRVLTAVDGMNGLEVAAANPDIDFVITDVVMPRMSGSEMAAQLRQRDPQLRLLFMTGYTHVSVELSAFEGAAILHKPFALAEIARAVQALLGNKLKAREESEALQ